MACRLKLRDGESTLPVPSARLFASYVRRRSSQAVLTLPELDARLRTFLVETYHQQPHSETGVPPQARWEANGFLPRLAESLEQLDLLLLTVAKPRRVHQDGIHFQGFRYIDLTLAAYVGEDVTIRYDPRDLAELRVYFGDSFLCRAINPELAGETVALKDIIRARNRRRRELRTTLAEREATVEALLRLRRGEEPRSERRSFRSRRRRAQRC